MSHFSRDYGQTSSWYDKGWAPSKSTYSGWSKRATRGYQANYDRDDRRHEWDDHASRGSNQARRAPPQTSAAADVEIVDERDKNQGMASANNATGSGADTATWVLVGDATTKKDAKYCDWENSIACWTVEKEASVPRTKRMPKRMK